MGQADDLPLASFASDWPALEYPDQSGNSCMGDRTYGQIYGHNAPAEDIFLGWR